MSKRYAELIEERGWADVGTTVCSDCLVDDVLIEVVSSVGGQAACDYCGEVPIAPTASAPVESILALIVNGLRAEYEDPVQQVLYSSADGGYQMTMTDTWDLVYDLEISEDD